jgi:hypothetical protein
MTTRDYDVRRPYGWALRGIEDDGSQARVSSAIMMLWKPYDPGPRACLHHRALPHQPDNLIETPGLGYRQRSGIAVFGPIYIDMTGWFKA